MARKRVPHRPMTSVETSRNWSLYANKFTAAINPFATKNPNRQNLPIIQETTEINSNPRPYQSRNFVSRAFPVTKPNPRNQTHKRARSKPHPNRNRPNQTKGCLFCYSVIIPHINAWELPIVKPEPNVLLNCSVVLYASNPGIKLPNVTPNVVAPNAKATIMH